MVSGRPSMQPRPDQDPVHRHDDLIKVESLHREANDRMAVPTESAPSDLEDQRRYRLHRRFDRLGRLYGDGAVERLMSTRVAVFGLGGVGSFAAEALARSAVGYLMLIDSDAVCVTNTNRQLQALKGNIGASKAELLRDRLRLINPQATIESQTTFYNAERSTRLLTPPIEWTSSHEGSRSAHTYDVVVDCIDNMTAKAHLIATCRAQGTTIFTSMGAAGRLDPGSIRVGDVSETQVCPMAKDVRKILRHKYGFPARGTFGVRAVYSVEPRVWPRALTYDRGQGFVCVCPHKNPEHSCDDRSLIDGTAVFVTGAFGLRLAGEVVNSLLADRTSAPLAPDRYGQRPATP